MAVTDDPWQPVYSKLRRLRDTWPTSSWTWDSRYTMLASSFSTALEPQARASAACAFDYYWDVSRVHTAPRGLQVICESTGGLREGQLLMAGRAGPLVVVGLWWPWMGSNMVTLRLGLGEYEADETPYPQVRALFGAR